MAGSTSPVGPVVISGRQGRHMPLRIRFVAWHATNTPLGSGQKLLAMQMQFCFPPRHGEHHDVCILLS